ncbi:MAG: hypothetical protein ACKO27_03360 [Ilumatobacteraceae bacterium]
MSQTALFIAGSVVTFIVFTGGFFYAMLSFGRWADRSVASKSAD